MQHNRARWELVFSLVLITMAAVSFAQSDPLEPKVNEIRRNPNRYLNEVVRIEGFVTQYVDGDSRSTSFYYLKDDWGGLIKVRTSGGPPAVGHRFAVVGPVSKDPATRDLFLSEEERISLEIMPSREREMPALSEEIPAAAPADAVATEEPEVGGEEEGAQPWWQSGAVLAGIGVVSVLVVGSVVALAVVLGGRRRPRPRTTEVRWQPRPRTADFAAAASVPAAAPPLPQQVIEGKTIKIHAPPPGTLKLLPGWLEVESGDDTVTEIRLFRLKGEERAETTFGRASGRPYVHIQLKPMTISSRQAAIRFAGSRAKIINFATRESNPTRVNERELDVDEEVDLNDGDRIQMGEVKFKFHTS